MLYFITIRLTFYCGGQIHGKIENIQGKADVGVSMCADSYS